MHRTEGANNTAGKLFTDGPPGTCIEQDWLNSVQEEIANVIEAAGISLSSASEDQRAQLLQALGVLYSPTANGVTNGDAHDHIGGDGAAIDTGALVNGAVDPTKTSFTSYYYQANLGLPKISVEAGGYVTTAIVSLYVSAGRYLAYAYTTIFKSTVSVPEFFNIMISGTDTPLETWVGGNMSLLLSAATAGRTIACGGICEMAASGSVAVWLAAYHDSPGTSKAATYNLPTLRLFQISD